MPSRLLACRRLVPFALLAALLCAGGAAAQADEALAAKGRTPMLPPVSDADFHDATFDPARVELGRLLFFDKILSGNRNISCATCHHSFAATGDGLALPIGEGGRGTGVTRDGGEGADLVSERVPRNAPTLFNLGAREFGVMFHDGRAELDSTHPSGFRSPAGDDLPPGSTILSPCRRCSR